VGKLIYSAIASLDGYVEDRGGRFDWAEPDEEVFEFLNDVERPVGTYLYGRRMYETMVFWEAPALDATTPAAVRDFAAIWGAADKVVFSRALPSVSSARTRIERSFDADGVRRIKAAQERDLTVGGAELAAQAIASGLVDELQLYVVPAVVGGGKPWLPGGVRLDLELREERRFVSGFVFLRYGCVRREEGAART
jgi:dihydrofolate reductase